MGEMTHTPEKPTRAQECAPCCRKGRSRFEGVSKVLESWERDGYATIPIEVSEKQIKKAIDSFVAFMRTPEALRAKICTYLPGDEKRVSLGVGIRKPESDDEKEHKEFFHYHPDIVREFENEILQAGPNAINFLKHADQLWVKVAKQVGELIEQQLTPAYYTSLTKRFIPDGEEFPHITLRFLAYKDTDDGAYSAKEHYDRGVMTLTIAESAPGLWIQNPRTGKRDSIKQKAGQAVFFPGCGFNYNVDPGIPPTLHGVEQTKGDRFNDDIVRWAIVAFVDIPNAPAPPKDSTVRL